MDTIIECMYEDVEQGVAGRPDLGSMFEQIAANDLARRRLDAEQVALIAEVCDQWHVDEHAIGAACEKLVDGGAAGTTQIGEFLAYELGPVLRISPTTAAFRIADVLNLRDRYPLQWQAVAQLRMEYWQATQITRATRHLSFEAAHWLDKQIDIAMKTMPWQRVMRALPDLIVKADPQLAAEKEKEDREQRLVRVGHYRSGGGTVYARLSAADAGALDETVSDLANRLLTGPDDIRTIDQRRAVALGLLAEPERAATILAGGDAPSAKQTTLFVHLPAGSVIGNEPGTIALVEGIGALTRESLTEFLGTTRVHVRPVVDHNSVPAVDAYQVPPLMREAVTQRWPVEVFPWASRRSRRLDMDHSDPFDHTAPAGTRQTRLDNLAPQSRRAHRARTGGGWHLDQPEPGLIRWNSRLGFRYEVTPHGTTSLGRTAPPGPASDRARTRPDLGWLKVPIRLDFAA